MADENSKYTHVGILKPTHKKIAILAAVANGGQGVNIYELVDAWAQEAWQEAKANGLVTDAMLPTPSAAGKPVAVKKQIRKSHAAVAAETGA